MSTAATGVMRLNPDDPDQVDAIAQLHTELLPWSIPARLGHHFMTRFYFTNLAASDLISCDLYAHEGKYVGFNVFTKYPGSFMREGIRRHFFTLCRISARIFASVPRRLAALLGMVQKDAWLRADQSVRAGYWLTFGVLESYRRMKIDERGMRVSTALVQAMLDYFREEGFNRVDGGVERNNKSAIFFYHACGFTIRDPGSGDDLRIHYDLAQDRSEIESSTRGNQ